MQTNMGTPIYNPVIPTVVPIPGGFLPGSMIRIQGQVLPAAERFAINLQCGGRTDPRDDIALHLNFRFVQQCIVRNNLTSMSWGQEEVGGGMPLHAGQTFETLLLCQHDCIKVAINGNHFCEWYHRMPYQKISHLTIDGDVNVSLIGFEGTPQAPQQPQSYAPPQPGAYGPPGGYGPPPPAYGAPPPAYGYQQGGFPPGYPAMPPGQPGMMGQPPMMPAQRSGPGIGTALAAGAAGGLVGGLAGGVIGNMVSGGGSGYHEAPHYESSGLNIVAPSPDSTSMPPYPGQPMPPTPDQMPPPPPPPPPDQTTQSGDFLENTVRAPEPPNPEPTQDDDDGYLENNEPAAPQPEPTADDDDGYLENDPEPEPEPAADDDDYLENDTADPTEADDGGDFGGDDWAE